MSEVEDLARRVQALESPDKLILAAELLRAKRWKEALAIAGGVVDEMRLMEAIRAVDTERGRRIVAEKTKAKP